MTVGYLAGRYLFDASATIAVATGVNRSTWLVKGEREIKNIIETESRTIFHSVHKGTRGKWFRAYSEEQPIFLQERGENLAFLLEERNQPQRLAGLLSRLENKIEPENLSKISGSRYYTQQYLSKVPAFEPAKLIASVQGLK